MGPAASRRGRARSWPRLALVLAVVIVGCSAAATPSPAPPTSPPARTFVEFRQAFCLAWGSLFEAVGNPDTGSRSDLLKAFEEAIAAGDLRKVDEAAASIRAELELGRRRISSGLAYPPGAEFSRQMDRILVAFEADIEARRMAAHDGNPNGAALGQAALEAAGGLEAWQWMMSGGFASLLDARPSGGEPEQCDGLPISL